MFGCLVVSCTEAHIRRVGEIEDCTFWARQRHNDFCGDGHVGNCGSPSGLDIQQDSVTLSLSWLGGVETKRDQEGSNVVPFFAFVRSRGCETLRNS